MLFQFTNRSLLSLGKMWHLIPAILYLTYVQANHHRMPGNPYPSVFINNERAKMAPYYYPAQALVPAQLQQPYNVPVRPYNDYPGPPSYSFQQQRQPFNEDPYYAGQQYNRPQLGQAGAYAYPNNLRQPVPPSKSNLLLPELSPFDLDYNTNDLDTDADTKPAADTQSYSDDLDLVENFGYYLKKRTQLDSPTTSLNDAAHQYNALLAVLMALARIVRNSCADFDQVYDQVYQSTVETYYKYGLANADKVSTMIEEYIRRGNSHIPRIRKVKQELCEKDLYCSVSVDNKIKSSALLYVKELETLEALAHLAHSYFPYIDEFNQAAQKGTMLPYLQNSKDRLREYVMHIVNSVEHLTDKPVRCTK